MEIHEIDGRKHYKRIWRELRSDPYNIIEEFKEFTWGEETYIAGVKRQAGLYGGRVETRPINEVIARAKELLDEGGDDRLLDEFIISTRQGGVQFYPRDRPRTDK